MVVPADPASESDAVGTSFFVAKEDIGKRTDRWLHECLPEMTRARIQALMKAGLVTCGEKTLRAHDKCQANAEVKLVIPPVAPSQLEPEDIPLDIIYEDPDIIVVNKPAGLVVHPAAGHRTGTLVNALLYHCEDLTGLGGEERPGIVHRLDKDTSGVMVVAKNESAMEILSDQFQERTVRKRYLAIVHGVPNPEEGTIETVIGRSRHDRKKMSVATNKGRSAISHYTVMKAVGSCSLVRVRIETGRTHQIRVHMAHIGCPVLGDATYGSKKADAGFDNAPHRQMLHAERLTLVHPRTGKKMDFKAKLPEDMQKVWQNADAAV